MKTIKGKQELKKYIKNIFKKDKRNIHFASFISGFEQGINFLQDIEKGNIHYKLKVKL